MLIKRYVDLITNVLSKYIESEIRTMGFFDDSDNTDNILYLCLIEAERIVGEIGNSIIEASDIAILAERKILKLLNNKYHLLETYDSYGYKTRIFSNEVPITRPFLE